MKGVMGKKAIISVSLDPKLLSWVDGQVASKRFASRSHAVEYALQRLREQEGIGK